MDWKLSKEAKEIDHDKLTDILGTNRYVILCPSAIKDKESFSITLYCNGGGAQ